MARPRPVPPPLSLVVKNGSKIRSAGIRRDPRSGVGNLQECHLAFPGGGDPEGSAGRHGVHGIGQKVENHLLHLMPVRPNRRKVGIRGKFERDVLRGEHGGHQVCHALDDRVQIGRLQARRLAPRGRQEALDRRHEPLNLAVNRDQASPILVGQPLTSLQ